MENIMDKATLSVDPEDAVIYFDSEDIADGPLFEELVGKILDNRPDVYGYLEFSEDITKDLINDFKATLDASGIPDDKDRIGNFVVNSYTNGPDALTDVPVRVNTRVIGETAEDGTTKYAQQIIIRSHDKVYCATIASDGTVSPWVDMSDDQEVKDGVISFIKGDTPPADITENNADRVIWIDTSGETPIFKYIANIDITTTPPTITWKDVAAPNYMDSEIYDPTHRETSMFGYINNEIEKLTGEYGRFLKHKANELTLIHISPEEKAKWDNAVTMEQLLAIVSERKEAIIESNAGLYEDELGVDSTTDEANEYFDIYNTHVDPVGNEENPPHITREKAANWDSKAEQYHQHNLDSRVTIRASDIVNGIIRSKYLPKEVHERVYEITSLEQLADPTISDEDRKGRYHTGNVLVISDPGGDFKKNQWFKITDPSLLGTPDYLEGILSFTKDPNPPERYDWHYVSNRPPLAEGFQIDDEVYTKDQFDEMTKNVVDKISGADAAIQKMRGYTKARVPLEASGQSPVPRDKLAVQIGGTVDLSDVGMALHASQNRRSSPFRNTRAMNYTKAISTIYDDTSGEGWGPIWREYADSVNMINRAEPINSNSMANPNTDIIITGETVDRGVITIEHRITEDGSLDVVGIRHYTDEREPQQIFSAIEVFCTENPDDPDRKYVLGPVTTCEPPTSSNKPLIAMVLFTNTAVKGIVFTDGDDTNTKINVFNYQQIYDSRVVFDIFNDVISDTIIDNTFLQKLPLICRALSTSVAITSYSDAAASRVIVIGKAQDSYDLQINVLVYINDELSEAASYNQVSLPLAEEEPAPNCLLMNTPTISSISSTVDGQFTLECSFARCQIVMLDAEFADENDIKLTVIDTQAYLVEIIPGQTADVVNRIMLPESIANRFTMVSFADSCYFYGERYNIIIASNEFGDQEIFGIDSTDTAKSFFKIPKVITTYKNAFISRVTPLRIPRRDTKTTRPIDNILKVELLVTDIVSSNDSEIATFEPIVMYTYPAGTLNKWNILSGTWCDELISFDYDGVNSDMVFVKNGSELFRIRDLMDKLCSFSMDNGDSFYALLYDEDKEYEIIIASEKIIVGGVEYTNSALYSNTLDQLHSIIYANREWENDDLVDKNEVCQNWIQALTLPGYNLTPST